MQTTPEITFKGLERTPDIDKLITRGIAKLERACDYIISARITVEQAQSRHQTDNPYRIFIEISVHDRPDIVVERWSNKVKKPLGESDDVDNSPVRKRSVREEALPSLIIGTFDSARRELEKIVDKQRGEVKVHFQQQAQAMVEKLFRDQQYGFLRTLDGQQIYFHENSVLHDHWENLRLGMAVRYTAEMGDKGLQASTVEMVEEQDAKYIHGTFHDSFNE